MKKTEEAILRFISENNLLPAGSSVLCALSGGADSVMLLSFLIKYSRHLKLESIGAAHFNHKLRGKESDADEAFCAQLCGTLGIPLYVQRADIKRAAGQRGISIEEAGRLLRYLFLKKTARRLGYSQTATAHHADDQAETVLHQIIKGGGLRGLAGILPRHNEVIRPLLTIRKHEILEWLTKSRLIWREDSSNATTEFERNFIRRNVLGTIREQFGESSITSLAGFSSAARAVIATADKLAEELYTAHGSSLPENKLKILPEELSVEIIRSVCFKITGLDPGARIAREVNRLRLKQAGRICDLGNNYRAVRTADGIAIIKTEKRTKTDEIEVICGSKVKIGSKTFTFSEAEMPGSLTHKPANIEYIGSQIKITRLLLRKREAGDFFYPLGAHGKKKISDFLSEMKVPVHQRDNVLLAYVGRDCVWVSGLRIDDRYKIVPGCKYIYRMELRG